MGCVCGKADLEIDERQFRIDRLLAKGGFSEVFLVTEVTSSANNNQKWALKRIECHSKEDAKRVLLEVEIHRRFGSHPNILAIECLCDEQLNDSVRRFSLIFTFFKKGTLQDELCLRRTHTDYIDQERVLRLFSQISNALSFLHSASPPIAHRDLKPGNVLISGDERPVLMDFGSCCECPIFIENSKQSQFQLDESAELCSMPYRAPELFVCAVGSVIDQSVDIWSLGCVLYAICFFRSPFDDIHERGDSIALAVQSGKINFDKNHPFSSNVIDLILTLLKVEPNDRPTIQTVCSELIYRCEQA